MQADSFRYLQLAIIDFRKETDVVRFFNSL